MRFSGLVFGLWVLFPLLVCSSVLGHARLTINKRGRIYLQNKVNMCVYNVYAAVLGVIVSVPLEVVDRMEVEISCGRSGRTWTPSKANLNSSSSFSFVCLKNISLLILTF